MDGSGRDSGWRLNGSYWPRERQREGGRTRVGEEGHVVDKLIPLSILIFPELYNGENNFCLIGLF